MHTFMVRRLWLYWQCEASEERSESVGWGWNGLLEGGMNLGTQQGGTQAW